MSSWTAIRGLISAVSSVQKVSTESTAPQASVDHTADEALMRRVQSGDAQALELLYKRYSRLVLSVGLRILRDASEAQELVQDVFLYLLQKNMGFDPSKSSLRSWLVQVAYSRAFNKREYLTLRRFYDYCQLDEVFDAIPSGSSPEQLGLVSEMRERIENGFAALNPQQRATLEMFFWEGYSLREISTHLQESLGNTRNHYYRGLEKLRQAFSAFSEKLPQQQKE